MNGLFVRISCLYLILLSSSIFSQITGTKFAPDSTYWREYGSWMTSFMNFSYTHPNKYIRGDSIIGTKYYQKIYYTNRSSFDTVCLGSINLVHYDNKKVFFNNNLIYNFNLTPGDTFSVYYNISPIHPPGYYTYTVSTRDSINVGNKWRTRIKLTAPFPYLVQNLNWVEGIGDINYGFNPSYSTIEFALSVSGFYYLNCFSEHFQNTYGSGCGVRSICSAVNQTSKMACNLTNSNINFNIYAGVAPFKFTFSPPSACALTYTAISTSTATTFSLTCAGIYTINLMDSNNSNLGTITHTVTLDTLINIGINTLKDTVCENQSTLLSIVNSSPSYTINPIFWSNGSVGPSTIATPSVTTTYSVNGLYTTILTRTCTAKGAKTIHVKSCVGIEEVNKLIYISIFPNPSNEKITIINNSGYMIQDIQFLTIEGKNTNLKPNTKNEIYIKDLAEGVYFVQLQTDLGIVNRKLIIQRD